MESIKAEEPESMLEVRRWKEKVSQDIETLGFDEFHRRAAKAAERMQEAIKAHKDLRLTKKAGDSV
jgi:hypothetical protein